MSKFRVLCYNDPLLRQKALPIAEITPEIEKLARDLVETMILYNGVGLAATQVGVLLRIFVFREERINSLGEWEVGHPEVVINPTLSQPGEETVSMQEGCISIPGLHISVVRPKNIHVRYQNLQGEWIEEQLTDFRARVMMHENDHLNGVLMIDRMDKRDRKKVEPHLLAIEKKYHKN